MDKDQLVRVTIEAVEPGPVCLALRTLRVTRTDGSESDNIDGVFLITTRKRIEPQTSTQSYEARSPPEIPHYRWDRRYNLFSKFDSGIQYDSCALEDTTPEAVADHLSRRLRRAGGAGPTVTVVDGCCGVGGNVISFAKMGLKTSGVEISATRIAMLRHNARIYGVGDVVDLHIRDMNIWACELEATIDTERASASRRLEDVGFRYKGFRFDYLFMSPPWGGSEYHLADVFQARNEFVDMCRSAKRVAENVVCFLPRNTVVSDLIDLARTVFECEVIEIEKLYSFHPELTRFIHVYFYNVRGRRVLSESTEATPLKALRNQPSFRFLEAVQLRFDDSTSQTDLLPRESLKLAEKATRNVVDRPDWKTLTSQPKDILLSGNSLPVPETINGLPWRGKQDHFYFLLVGCLCTHLDIAFESNWPDVYYILRTAGLSDAPSELWRLTILFIHETPVSASPSHRGVSGQVETAPR
ncbi:MAG: uncharacterized protein KVP18_003513 [Porospora cf. gigantea A]|uniref:uncharacterized protein n=1 Tax=Porospora cf. gigantea A TaxID=2853593 RepID=UPI0035597BFA|nr:MAG: hypothetical protein KVP18_003513 [Porospora cf. gigantea A]